MLYNVFVLTRIKTLVLSPTNFPTKGLRSKRRIFLYIVSGSERTYTCRLVLNALPTLATLVGDM